jgi:hypothetical protein
MPLAVGVHIPCACGPEPVLVNARSLLLTIIRKRRTNKAKRCVCVCVCVCVSSFVFAPHPRHPHTEPRDPLHGFHAVRKTRCIYFLSALSLCLSQGCLGKLIILSIKWYRKRRVFVFSHLNSSCSRQRATMPIYLYIVIYIYIYIADENIPLFLSFSWNS